MSADNMIIGSALSFKERAKNHEEQGERSQDLGL